VLELVEAPAAELRRDTHARTRKRYLGK